MIVPQRLYFQKQLFFRRKLVYYQTVNRKIQNRLKHRKTIAALRAAKLETKREKSDPQTTPLLKILFNVTF